MNLEDLGIDEGAFRYEVFSFSLGSEMMRMSKNEIVKAEHGNRFTAMRNDKGRAAVMKSLEKSYKEPYLLRHLDQVCDTFVIVVGFHIFDDEKSLHKGTPLPSRRGLRYGRRRKRGNTTMIGTKIGDSQSNMSYESLTEILTYAGFDPLKKIRTPESKRKYDSELRTTVLSYIKRSNITFKGFENVVEKLAKKIANDLVDYIWSGDKPALSDATIDIRKRKKKNIPSLYPDGIESSLIESGQLANSVEYDAYAIQSEEMSSFIKWYENKKIESKKELARENARRRIIERRKVMRGSHGVDIEIPIKEKVREKKISYFIFKHGPLAGFKFPKGLKLEDAKKLIGEESAQAVSDLKARLNILIRSAIKAKHASDVRQVIEQLKKFPSMTKDEAKYLELAVQFIMRRGMPE